MPPPFPDEEAEVTTPPPPKTDKTKPVPETDNENVAKAPPASTDTKKIMAVESTTEKTAPVSEQPDKKKQPNKKQPVKPEKQEVKTPTPTATSLLANSFKIAALSAEIKRKLEAKAERPRRKFISASTREYKYAAYMEAWRAKVERVGNLNYPDEARRRKLSGNLILDVALNPDGSINEIIVRRSSGYKFLDAAAIRIVKLASPFAPFPDNIRAETDILHITRTWQFLNNRGFR
jgi:protein TonB